MRYQPGGLLALNYRAIGLDFAKPADQRAPASDVVVIRGPLEQHDGHWCDSYDAILKRVSDAFSGQSQAVWLLCNSPGGAASGLLAACAKLRELADQYHKPLYAFVDGEACSACYALACAADQVVCAQDAWLGSVGVIEVVQDRTAHDAQYGERYELVTSGAFKALGNPHEVLTDAGRAEVQRRVDSTAGLLFQWVAERRGLDAQPLEARVFQGGEAVSVGLADSVALTFDAARAAVAERISGGVPAEGQGDMAALKTVAAAVVAQAAKKAETGSKLRKMLLELASEDTEDGAEARRLLGAQDGGAEDPPAPEPPKPEPPAAEDEELDEEELASASASGAETDEKRAESETAAASAEDEAAKKAAAEGDAKKAAAASRRAAAARARAAVFAAAARVQTAERQRARAEQRAAIMATRPDLTPEIRALADTAVPTAKLQAFLDKIPAGAPALLALRAPVGVVGQSHQAAVDATVPAVATNPLMAMAMAAGGLGSSLGDGKIERQADGTLVLDVHTPAQARAALARKGAQ